MSQINIDSNRELKIESVIGKSRKKKKFNLSIYLFLIPSIIFVGVFMLYPLLYSFGLSFMEYNFVYDDKAKFVGFGNYIKMFTDKTFLTSLYNTLYFAVIFFVLLIGFSLGIALLLESKLKGMIILRTVVFLPVIVAMALSGVVFQWILNENFGVLNHILTSIGLERFALNWLGNPNVAIYTIIAVSLWKYCGIICIMFLAGLQAIPKELYEAAKIDGAGSWSSFIHITLPNLKESFIITGVYGIMQSLKVFEQPFVLTYGGPADSTSTLYFYAWRNGFEFYDMGYASSIAYFIAGLVLAFSLLQIMLLNKNKSMN
ncbi:carbohydrate ABC transporter permease [Bacillus timonensis]|uniref:carbohydrate ABC transporter permease n=1 Tax=Bacillus timonensis TaxID=1033734 RepID=UPI0002898F09|nr:sugar ABC transporter permease [Bacillus timonensis]